MTKKKTHEKLLTIPGHKGNANQNHIKIPPYSVTIATIKNIKWGKRKPHTLLVGMPLAQPLWKTIWRLLNKLNIDLPYDPAIPPLGIYPKECDSGYSKGTCTPKFVAALFTIAKLWTQLRYPTTDEWNKKM
jgi:hypothetical protein